MEERRSELQRRGSVHGKVGRIRMGARDAKYYSYADKVARRGVPAWMLYTGEGEAEEGGMREWERRLRELEKGYRRLFGDQALSGYDLEDEVRRFKVRAH